MKKLFASTAVIFGFAMSASAQKSAVKIDTFSTPTIQCEMCKDRISEYLRRVDGVTFVNVAVKKKIVIVKYLKDRTNDEMIKTSIANAGFDADEIKANPDSYKMLPKCCKKPEDGGGMPKN